MLDSFSRTLQMTQTYCRLRMIHVESRLNYPFKGLNFATELSSQIINRE